MRKLYHKFWFWFHDSMLAESPRRDAGYRERHETQLIHHYVSGLKRKSASIYTLTIMIEYKITRTEKAKRRIVSRRTVKLRWPSWTFELLLWLLAAVLATWFLAAGYAD